jgi:bifunctional non-homologous end joining protein LigD
VVGSGERFFQHACRLALEGAVAKLRDAPYRQGRTRDWVKVKCLERQEFVIGGFARPSASSRSGIGSLVLGVRDDEGELTYVGRVGTGFTEKTLADLAKRLQPLITDASPFKNEVTGRARGKTVWVKPVLVADIDFSEWTADEKLRHPTYRGLREDKSAGEVVRDKPSAETSPVKTRKTSVRPPRFDESPASGARAVKDASKTTPPPKPTTLRPARSGEPARVPRGYTRGGETAEVAGVKITHADRVVYPEEGITKLDLARFYVDIEPWILPHLVGRPTTLVRCPDGLAGPCFYQKHRGYWAPDTLRRVQIQEKTKIGEYLVVDTLAALVGLVQIGILEIHTWNSIADTLEQPDRIVIDLDPDEELPFSAVMDAARVVRDRLEEDGLRSFVKTTGGKGLHVVAPLLPEASWDDCADYSRRIAEELAGASPRRFVAVMTKAKRSGRVFLDWLRNVRGSTSVAAYSTRAKPVAPLSVPLAWRELSAKITPDRFRVTNVRRRLDALGEDPWSGYTKLRQRLPRRGS